jgi:hypothetical protein
MAVAGALFSLWLFDQTWNIFSDWYRNAYWFGNQKRNLIVELRINYANKVNLN